MVTAMAMTLAVPAAVVVADTITVGIHVARAVRSSTGAVVAYAVAVGIHIPRARAVLVVVADAIAVGISVAGAITAWSGLGRRCFLDRSLRSGSVIGCGSVAIVGRSLAVRSRCGIVVADAIAVGISVAGARSILMPAST